MKKKYLLLMILPIFALIAACGGAFSTTTKSSDTSPISDNSLSNPKDSIVYQLQLIKSGDVVKLQTCFTDRVKDSVTKDAVEKAKTDAVKYTIDDLVGSVEMGESDGKKTAKIKMKNERTLTTLIETNGKWLADTIWFD